MAEVALDLAGQLVSVIAASSADRRGIKAGDQVSVIVKSTEVMLAKESHRPSDPLLQRGHDGRGEPIRTD